MRILILNGPNLNLLGQRERSIYGTQSLPDLEGNLRRLGQQLGVDVDCYQSNQEGHLIDALHRARTRCGGVIFNPGGYTHTSVALRDAIAGIEIPVIEVHLSNLFGREEFRQKSITGGPCAGVICGLGAVGYELALTAMARILRQGLPATVAAAAVAAAPAPRPVLEREARDSSREPRPEQRAEGREPREARPEVRGESREPRAGEETEEERESKRRRRGRRGGRGRRREGFEGAAGAQGSEQSEETANAAPRRPELPPEERYANLKGVTVRRGIDVLAEEEGETPVVPQSGAVTFRDAAGEAAPGGSESRIHIAPSGATPTERPARRYEPTILPGEKLSRRSSPESDRPVEQLDRAPMPEPPAVAPPAEPAAESERAEAPAPAANEPAREREEVNAEATAAAEATPAALEPAEALEPADSGRPAKKSRARKTTTARARKTPAKAAKPRRGARPAGSTEGSEHEEDEE